MKKIILLLFVSVFLFEASAYDKLSLVERFTNVNCGPCAVVNVWYNPLTQGWVNSGYISHIVYNTWWPSSTDPMYLLNQADNTTRTNYYQPGSPKYVPWIETNGVTTSTNPTALTNAVNNGNAEFAPFKIEIIQQALGETLIEVGVKIVRDPTDITTFNDVKLRVALTEKTVSYASPPGSNGEKDFFSICRKMLPDAGGSAFTVPAPGDSVEFTLQYVPTSEFLQAVNFDSIRVVAFIQDDPSQIVYQSAMLELIPNYVANITTTSPDLISSNITPAEFTTLLSNVGVLDDTYEISIDFNGPSGWTGEFTTVNGTFAFGDVDSVQVAVGESTTINVTVNPNGFNGSGETSVVFASKNDPGVTGSVTLRNVTNTGVPGLILDASGEGYANLLSGSMDQEFDYPYGIVNKEALTPSVDLTNFTFIAWSTGNAYPVFTEDEVDALIPFLDNGGRLLINGQNIGEDIFGASGQSQFAQSFYNDYLHASYVSDVGLTFFLKGINGDPISDQQNFSLINLYPRSPDQFIPNDGFATSLFTFSTYSQYNSIRADDGVDRVVYLGFGLEQVADDLTRDTIATRSIRWLMDGIVLNNPKEDMIATTFNLSQNYPNPFNPSTTITYSIPDESKVSLKIYDVMGREIAELVNERQSAGSHAVKFNASSIASGTYFYKLSTDGFVSVKKMTLLK